MCKDCFKDVVGMFACSAQLAPTCVETVTFVRSSDSPHKMLISSTDSVPETVALLRAALADAEELQRKQQTGDIFPADIPPTAH